MINGFIGTSAMTYHRQLDDELTTLRSMLAEMSTVVDEQLTDAINAAINGDEELAQRVRRRDDEVDALELKIDHECERLLALYTPVAADLRLLITVVKVNTDLERIGDQAKNIAKSVLNLTHCQPTIKDLQIRELGDLARRILRDAQDALAQRDRILARQVLVQDREIDALYKRLFHDIVRRAAEHPEMSAEFAHLTGMIKSIERVADHAKNIAELVVFLIEGVDIRHRRSADSTAE